MGSSSVSMMKRIILHGHLKKLYDKPIEVEASSVAEAMRFLEQIPELKPKDGQPWPVTIRGIDSQLKLFAETDLEEIHVHPRTGGAGGKGGLLQIIIGIALIALAIVNPAFLATLGITNGMLYLTGGMMVLGGLVQMLMPVPETDSTEGSMYLGAGVNTVKIGTRIPILYGTRKIGGHYLSFDGKPNYFKYDAPSLVAIARPDGTAIRVAPFRPVYASATPSPTNIPSDA
jgi:predicted phage tail protein